MKIYETVIFLQGDDYTQAEEVADAATKAALGDDDPFWPGLYRGCAEWVEALREYLMQWEYGEPVEPYDGPETPWGSSDDVDISDGYAVAWNTRYGYAGLTRVKEGEES